MREFSIGGAWSKGIGFFSGAGAGHAIILIGIGILAPAALQYLLAGEAAGMTNPAMMGQNAFGSMAYLGATVLLVMVVGYVLQTGSYFSSWRLGLGRDESAPGAILYGLIAAVAVLAMLVALFVLMGALIGLLGSGGSFAVVIPLLLLVIPLFMLLAALYTIVMTLVAVMMVIVLLLAMAFGASAGGMNPALAVTGGGGIALLITLAFILLLFWLTARFSCATAVMAERKSVNLFGAIAESWRMTAEDQWRIIGYLTLLGILLCVGVFIFALIVGVSMMGSMQPGQVPQMGAGAVIVTLIVSIPFAYLTVLVPAGIYLELYEDLSADVFA